MIISTQWHNEFVADLASECSGLCKFEMMRTMGCIGLITVPMGSSESRAFTSEDQKRLCAPDFPPLRFRNPECRSDYGLHAKAESQSQRRLRKRIPQSTGATGFDEVMGPELTSGTDINVNRRHCLLCHADKLVSSR
jgi:hypothetical protein